MATNTEARVLASIWRDGDWLALPIDCQWLYELFLSQSGIDRAGVLFIPRQMWAKHAADEDASDRIHAALKILVDRRFVVVDDDTDELLVRSYIRRAVQYGPPGTFISAMNAATGVRSARLRAVLYEELLRLDVAMIESKKIRGGGDKPIAAYRSALKALEPGGPPHGPGPPIHPEDRPAEHGMTEPESWHDGAPDMPCGPETNFVVQPVEVGVEVVVANGPVESYSTSATAPRAGARTPEHTPARTPEHTPAHTRDPVAAYQGQDPPRERSGVVVAIETGVTRLPPHIQARLDDGEPEAPAVRRNATVRAMTLFDDEVSTWPIPPLGRERGKWVHAVANLLREGIPAPAVVAGMRACSGKGCPPRLLDSFVFGEANRRGPESRADRNTKAILSRITPDGGPSLAELEAAEEAERAALALQRRKAIEGG